MMLEIQVYDDHKALSLAVANRIAAAANLAVAKRSVFHLVLSGGGTPNESYRILAEWGEEPPIPWSNTHLFWGDERGVAPEDPGSNYGQAKTILIDRVPIPRVNVHRIKGELTVDEAAADYRRTLRQLASSGQKWPIFDIVLLGLGTDGHTASLFPGTTIDLDNVAAIPAHAVYENRPVERITLTPAIINDSREVMFLVSGLEKSEAVAETVRGKWTPETWPAQQIRPRNGSLTWLLDKEAASLLK